MKSAAHLTDEEHDEAYNAWLAYKGYTTTELIEHSSDEFYDDYDAGWRPDEPLVGTGAYLRLGPRGDR